MAVILPEGTDPRAKRDPPKAVACHSAAQRRNLAPQGTMGHRARLPLRPEIPSFGRVSPRNDIKRCPHVRKDTFD